MSWMPTSISTNWRILDDVSRQANRHLGYSPPLDEMYFLRCLFLMCFATAEHYTQSNTWLTTELIKNDLIRTVKHIIGLELDGRPHSH